MMTVPNSMNGKRELANYQLKNFQDILLWLELEKKLYEKDLYNASLICGKLTCVGVYRLNQLFWLSTKIV